MWASGRFSHHPLRLDKPDRPARPRRQFRIAPPTTVTSKSVDGEPQYRLRPRPAPERLRADLLVAPDLPRLPLHPGPGLLAAHRRGRVTLSGTDADRDDPDRASGSTPWLATPRSWTPTGPPSASSWITSRRRAGGRSARTGCRWPGPRSRRSRPRPPSGPASAPAGRCRWPRGVLGQGRGQAVQDAPAVHEPLGGVAGGGEGVGDALVGDQDAAAVGQPLPGRPQRPRRVAHVVERLEDRHQVERGLGGEVGGVADHERDPVGQAGLGRRRAGLGDRRLVQVDPEDLARG